MYSVTPVFEHKYLTWECTTWCNYACTYCPPECHSGKYRWPNEQQTENLIQYIKEFRQDKTLVLDIMGGEPTLWPGFRNFCNYVGEFSVITFSSNGSRTARWWRKFEAPIGHLLFSFHPENADIDHYVEMLNEIHNKYKVTVLILYHPEYKSYCQQVFDRLTQGDLNIGVSMKRIWGQEYTSEEEQELKQTKWIGGKSMDSRLWIDMKVDGQIVNKDHFLKEERNKFLGWECNLGENYRYIRADGSVWGASCKVGWSLGNVYDDQIIAQPRPIVCGVERCDCLVDITLNSKRKI